MTIPTYVPVPDIAVELGVVVTKVHQLIRDRALLAVRRDGVLRIPAEFVADGVVVKGLTGTITQLTDVGYSDQEIIDWLFADDDSLPGSPITALRENRGREVHRRAQVAGY
ncbi:Rv2175c family DNA-binding protein [Nakamurella lactea]|uniref:Rv2175c family DNA-binding protein n=1 Tax=Nakamurella lactea TaxID=459515 RepID=UPI00040F4C76|nr:Rv2175c family DNA-binding protein [Nakamurella lactea]